MACNLDYEIASLRRLYHHVIHGGTLSDNALKRTGGADTPEAISALIRELEMKSEVLGR